MSIYKDPKYCGFDYDSWTTVLAALSLAEQHYPNAKAIRYAIYSQLATQDYIRVEFLTDKLPALYARETSLTQTLQNKDCVTSQQGVSSIQGDEKCLTLLQKTHYTCRKFLTNILTSL